MQLSASDRAVVITGGSQGLGLATAKAYAAAGADVAILARRPGPLEAARAELEALGRGRVLAISCDVSAADSLAAAHAEIERTLGRIDIVVNNAGTARALPFEGIDDALWQADLDMKLFAAIRLTRLAWPGMKARRWGRVINVLNTYAKAPEASTGPTSVTRAAGLALTKLLAAEGAPHNILVNALLVGRIESEQIHRFHERSQAEQSYEDFIAGLGRQIPLGRIGRAEEFAGTALFLRSEAAGYLTGTAINVDGGLCPVV